MKVQKSVVIAMFVSGLAAAGPMAAPAVAYENFIPLGPGYSPQVDSVPAFESAQDEISRQSDIYESELYWLQRKEAEENSRFRRFFSDAESIGVGDDLDY